MITFFSSRIKFKALGGYLFCLFLVYLAGSYFGDIMLFFFYSLILLPVCSGLFFIIAVSNLKFSQSFSTDHPIKGETIKYTVFLSNESIFGISQVTSRFVTINPLMTTMVPDFRLSLKARETRELIYNITCTYRGIYKVGLDCVQVTDFLNFLTVNIPVWHKTFYVYPRIIGINSFSFGIESFYTKGTETANTGLEDNTLLKGIREYRRIEPARNIYWKKFAACGLPVLKVFDTSTSPGVAFYLDMHNDHDQKRQIRDLEREDVSIEILTALVRYFLRQKVSVSVRAPCRPIFSFKGDQAAHFQDYYRQTINIFAGPNENPIYLFNVDLKNGMLEAKSIIFITHRVTPELFNFVETALISEFQVMVIFNHTGSPAEEQVKNKRFFNSLRDKGARIADVHSPQTIAKDLENCGKV